MSLQGPIFIVDDDDAVRDSLKTLLSTSYDDVREFPSGQEFLDRYRRGERGCLILDLHLPGMDGSEILDRMAAASIRLPTVLITGRVDDDIRARAAQAGVVALLDKPIEFDDLDSAVERALAQG